MIALSTDKAVNPVNLYGATKLCAEKIFTQGNTYAAAGDELATRFAIVRYGNVVGSRGSVIPLFKSRPRTGELTITDEAMTRFWITLEQAVDFVIKCPRRCTAARSSSRRSRACGSSTSPRRWRPTRRPQIIGIRPGEKLHEVLLTADEARHAAGFDDYYAIYPSFPFWRTDDYPEGEELAPGSSTRATATTGGSMSRS